MTPEEKTQLNELMQYMKEKKRQQISFPLDEASRGALGGNVFPTGSTGAYPTQDIVLSGNAETITPPAQPSGTVTVTIDGTDYNLVHKT